MKKRNLFLIIILTIICCGCNNESSLNTEQENKDKYIVIDEYKVLNYRNNNWKVSDNINTSSTKWQEFKIYYNNQYINNYYFKLNNNIGYYFDEEYKSHEIKSNLAINADINTQPTIYNETEFTTEDYEIALNLLKKLKYNYNTGLTTSKKISVDADNDNEYEYLYIISNRSSEIDDSDLYYIIFLRDDNKNNIVVNLGVDDLKLYDIAWFLNITNGKYCDIILKYNYTETDEYDVYQYINNEYQLVIDKDEVITPEETNKTTIEINYTAITIITLLIIAIIFTIFIIYKKRSDLANKI